MWFIGVEVEQETSAPPPQKKSWIRPWNGHLELVPAVLQLLFLSICKADTAPKKTPRAGTCRFRSLSIR